MEEIIEVICDSESPSTPWFNIADTEATGEQKENRIFPQKRICNINGGVKRGCAQEVCFLTSIISSIYCKRVAVLHTEQWARPH